MDLFDGLELVEPDLVTVPEWRPDPGTPSVHDHPVLQMACVGVARKTRKPQCPMAIWTRRTMTRTMAMAR